MTGYYFGAGTAADAFFVAFRLPNLLRRFVGEGAMSVAFIPVFTEYLRHSARAAQAERALRAARHRLHAAVVAGADRCSASRWRRTGSSSSRPGSAPSPRRWR